MTTLEKARGPLRGEVTVPGDKSISHRSIMFGALAEGDTNITGFLESADCLSTIDCFRKLGITIVKFVDHNHLLEDKSKIVPNIGHNSLFFSFTPKGVIIIIIWTHLNRPSYV